MSSVKDLQTGHMTPLLAPPSNMLDPINNGAAMTDQSENCVRDCSGLMCTFACWEEPTSISGSFQPPGPAKDDK